tara:strand:+ start:4405 stop:5592 length:1188 start_codon:yes stop_codon:yes gene_type:complete
MGNQSLQPRIQTLEDIRGLDDPNPLMLLGLDSWHLRSLPEGLLRKFLEDYAMILLKYHHPDRFVNDPGAQEVHGKYVTEIRKRIVALVADPLELKYALRNLGSFDQLRSQEDRIGRGALRESELEERIADLRGSSEVQSRELVRLNGVVSGLSWRLEATSGEYESKLVGYRERLAKELKRTEIEHGVDLRLEVDKRVLAKRKAKAALERQDSIHKYGVKLAAMDRGARLITSYDGFGLSYVPFENVGGGLNQALSEVFALESSSPGRFEREAKEIVGSVEGEETKVEVKKNRFRADGESVEILGGMPYFYLRGFCLEDGRPADYLMNEGEETKEVDKFRRNFTVEFAESRRGSLGHFRRVASPYTTGFVFPGLPALVKEGRRKYKLILPTKIEEL